MIYRFALNIFSEIFLHVFFVSKTAFFMCYIRSKKEIICVGSTHQKDILPSIRPWIIITLVVLGLV